jgi:hypothetical protein
MLCLLLERGLGVAERVLQIAHALHEGTEQHVDVPVRGD